MTAGQKLSGAIGLAVCFIVYVVPFIFIFQLAGKDVATAAQIDFAPPKQWQYIQNFWDVVKARDCMLMTAYANSIIITFGAIVLLVIFGAMIGYVLQRRPSGWNKIIWAFVLAGFMIPPAIVPTIWVLQGLHLFKSIWGMILVQTAYGLSFSILLFRSFIASIPRELDEAAIMDGANAWQVFYRIILPLLRPVTIAVVVIQAVTIFNDFTNPLYYLPGKNNVTVQLTLYNFQSQFESQFNLLFMNILLLTIPPFVVFLFFNRQIVAGMTSGAVKG